MARLLKYVVHATSERPLADNYVPVGVKMTNAEKLWGMGYTGKDVIVAVIDSGIDPEHLDLKGRHYPLIDLTTSGKAFDEVGHGTHVIGTICANGNIKGVAPDAKVLPIKIFDATGSCDDALVAKAYRIAADWVGPNGERVNIINASIGGAEYTEELHEAVKYAQSKCIILPTAAGNEGDGNVDSREYSYPGAFQEVVEVAAVSSNGASSHFSNTNEQVDVCNVGEYVDSTWPTYMGKNYACLSGTSMATPHEAGICAIAYQMFKSLNKRNPNTEDEFWQFVKQQVRPLNLNPEQQGLGLGYLHDELMAAPTPQPELPLMDIYLKRGQFDFGWGYAIQTGAYREKANAIKKADALQAIFEAAGYKVRRFGF